jgi:hypothetical protein
MRSGKHSKRIACVLGAIALGRHADPATFRDLYEHGFYPPPNYDFNGDYKGLIRYLYWKWFDSHDPAQSNPIKRKQLPPLPARLPASKRHPPPPPKPEIEKKTPTTIPINPHSPLSTRWRGAGGEVVVLPLSARRRGGRGVRFATHHPEPKPATR